MLVYIHIGTHKTGTTSIQGFLRNHSQRLQAAGIYVPVATTFEATSGHHNLPFDLLGDSRFDPSRGGLQELIEELGQQQTAKAVVSAEDLEYLVTQPGDLARLEAAMFAAGHTIRYLMFVRRADQYAESLYPTLRGCGVRPRLGFIGYALEILLTGRYQFIKPGSDWIYSFDYPQFARQWRKIARAPLHIDSFDRAVQSQGVIASFLSLIQAPADLIEQAHDHPMLNSRPAPKKEIIAASRHRRLIGLLLRWRFLANELSYSAYGGTQLAEGTKKADLGEENQPPRGLLTGT